MSVTTRKVDDRSRVVLPEVFTGKLVRMEQVGDSEVRIRIKRMPRLRPSLTELLSRVTEANQHEPVDFGPPQGDEVL